MRQHRVWVAVALLGVAALLLMPAASSAQMGVGFGRYGAYAGTPYYGYSPGYYGYSPGHYGYGYSPYGSGGLSWPGAYSYTQRYYWYGDNWPYRGYNVGTYNAPPYFPNGSSPSMTSGRDSSYSYGAAPRTEANTALVTVRVPDPNAEVWIEGQRTQQRGASREFVSPPLNPDKNYTYEIRARWTENGRDVERTKSVPVRANGTATVDFTASDNRSRTDDIDRGRDTTRPKDTTRPERP